MPRVAVVIIGDEILSGKFADENGPYAIRRLRELGADLMHLATISDGVEHIAEEVRRCSERWDAVITTGGVGPTHDDRTFEGVAAAFRVPIVLDEGLAALLDRYGLPKNEASLRMAKVPLGAELLSQGTGSFPVVLVRNVYVFPGVPKLFHAKFEGVSHRFAGQVVQTARLYTESMETEIAAHLSDVQLAEPGVSIGSYPRFAEGTWKVIITLESRDAVALARARDLVASGITLVDGL